MPVDPRILLTGQPAHFDPMGAMLQAQQFQQQQQQLQLQRESQAALADERQAMAEQRRQQTAASQAQAQEDAQLSQLFANGRFPTPGEIYRIVKDPKRATSVVDGLMALRKTSFESEDAFRKNLATEARGILALPESMRPNAYQIAREKYKALGIDVAGVPEQYDPAVVQSFIDRVTEPKAPTLIDTVDANGNPVKKAVVPKPGDEFPQAPPKVTYGAPQTQTVNGKRVLVRPGSDGKMYGMDLKPIEGNQIQPNPEPPKAPGSFEQQIADALAKGDQATVDRLTKAAELAAGAKRAGVQVASDDMPATFKNALDRAVMSVPDRRRGSVIATANRLWSEGNEQELKDVIKQAALEGEDVTTKNQIRNRAATIDALNDAKQMLDELKASGVNPGWFTGTIEDLYRRFGNTTDPKLVAFKNRLSDTLINYRRAATGAAFGVKEGNQYEQMFPNYKQTIPVDEASIAGLIRAMTGNDKTYWENKLGKDGAALVGIGAGGNGKIDPMGIRH